MIQLGSEVFAVVPISASGLEVMGKTAIYYISDSKYMDEMNNTLPAGTGMTEEAVVDQNVPELSKSKKLKIIKLFILLVIILAIGVLSYKIIGNKSKKLISAKVEQCELKPTISQDKYVPGQIVIVFKQNLTSKEVESILSEKGLSVEDKSVLEEPNEKIIHWAPEFLKNDEITLTEVNNFLDLVRREPYIQDIEIGTSWHQWPMTDKEREAAKNQVQKIDRWGEFILTFSDISKKDAFFAKYPEATFLGTGQIRGMSMSSYLNPKKITILYKSAKVMDILEDIRKGIGKGEYIEIPSNFIAREEIDGEMVEFHETSEKIPVIFLENNPRNYVEDSVYYTMLGVNFPSGYSQTEIRTILEKYPEIDINKISGYERWNTVSVKVPVGKEICWIEELKQNPKVDYVDLNYLME